ncbi:HAD-IA family hydrolase [Agrococcus sp. BE272]|uniref:HAD-IA family hydrolase n=1 Tax=Agrococcus sp. BE272 TaxID=2817727 RepID=UPI002865555C|nr:HAD-IA family hydrolase [Agrococcus sp. BE272]MDR7233197.1 beta-phosphoglucomutase family hydrolase [Agrococcus sp. BE272]
MDAVYDAVLFDMDGVVTDTAVVHAAAWKRLFDEVLQDPRARARDPERRFDAEADYRRYVDGRSREDGVAAYLGARGISLQAGRVGDPPDAWTVAGLAARKDALFIGELRGRGLRVYPGTLALLRRLREAGVPTGLVTASRNAHALLAAAGLSGAFDTVVDGEIALADRLAGKPHPALFLEAAARLGVAPARAALIEDSVAGVEAGRRGGFGLVVGIARSGQREELEAAGADVVLLDVAQLDLGARAGGTWSLLYEGFDREHEGHREALTALGNGRFATRGALPEHRDDGVHYPGTYLAGVYNRVLSAVHGREIAEEHLVNAPNWLRVDLRVGGGRWLSSGALVASDRRELDLRRAVAVRRATLVGPEAGTVDLVQRCFVSMDDPHVAVLETTLAARGWSGPLELRAGIDADVRNTNVQASIGTDATHLSSVAFRELDDVLLCEAQTSQSRVEIATAVRWRMTGADGVEVLDVPSGALRRVKEFRLRLDDGRPVTFTTLTAIFTSRDRAISEPGEAALGRVRGLGDVAVLRERHSEAWRRLWELFEVSVDADRQSRLILNLHVFHILQTLSPHTAELDAGVPARGLHGEGYRGHVFWDEVFVMPVVALRLPDLSRALLEYRWRRLGTARAAASRAGLDGALFPWQSGSDGREETPTALYNPRSERWMPDNSHRQRHVGLAIGYNAWLYFQATGDREWLADRGAELIVEVVRLFASLAQHDPLTDRFHIDGVMGPDEFHDGPPDRPGTGLRDNAYTNVLVSWLAARAAQSFTVLRGHLADSVRERLAVTDAEVERWRHLSRRLSLSFHRDGVLAQFDGYEQLEELDWAGYRERYGNIGRLDLILESEDDSTNRYKLSKQPDVVMLVHLLGCETVCRQVSSLGYAFSQGDLLRTMDYYVARTSHGSTLSRVVHASALASIDPARSWSAFREALVADLDDAQGGTTREGVHLGAMAGTVDIPVRAFAGLMLEDGLLALEPRLPPRLSRLAFRIRFRGHLLDVAVEPDRATLRSHAGTAPPIRVRVAGVVAPLEAGQAREFSYGVGRDSSDAVKPQPA